MAQAATTGVTAVKPRGQLHNKFLMKLAIHELTSKEQFSLGVLLEMEPSTIRQIIRDSEEAVTSTFAILEAWRNNRKSVGTYSASYDQLCEAYLELKRADIAEYIRREQIRHQSAQLEKAKEANQRKMQFNEQIRLARQEQRQAKEELDSYKKNYEKDVQQLSEQVRVLKVELQKTRALSAERLSIEAAAQPALSAERLSMEAAAQPVVGETENGSKRRALHVIALLRQYRQPELWRHVSQHIVKYGKLDVRCVITSAQIHDLVYLLTSSAASDVISLDLGGNWNKPVDTFGDKKAIEHLCRGLAAMPQLRQLILWKCNLTNDGFIIICETIRSTCQQMTLFDCSFNETLSSAIEPHVTETLTTLSGLEMHLTRCCLSRDVCDRLEKKFRGSIEVGSQCTT